jgi:hypothetical protein
VLSLLSVYCREQKQKEAFVCVHVCGRNLDGTGTVEQIWCKFLVQVSQDERRGGSFVSCWDGLVKIFLRFSLEKWRDEQRRGEERGIPFWLFPRNSKEIAMAGSAGPTMMMSSLWPRLRRHVRRDGRKKKRKENPYASRGLETFSQLVAELQEKRLAMVDKTTKSASAVRSLSKSAQEWTALALSRTASKRISSSRTEVVSQAPPPPDARSMPQASAGNTASGTKEECKKSPRQEAMTGAEEAGFLDAEHRAAEEIAELLPLKVMRRVVMSSRKRRGVVCVREKKMAAASSSSKSSAVAVLVAVGAFFASKRAEIGKQVAAVLTFSIVIQRWPNDGKLYTRFIFSAMASYLLYPLHSYLSAVRVPKRLTIGSGSLLRKVEGEEEGQEKKKKTSPPEAGTTTASPIDQQEHQDQQNNASFVASPPSFHDSSSAPFSIPRPAAAAEINNSPSSTILPISPTNSEEGSGGGSPSTNLRKKLSLKLKSRFVKSLSSSNLAPGNTPPDSPGSPTTAAASGSSKQLSALGGGGSPTLSPISAAGTENSDSDTASSSSAPSSSSSQQQCWEDDAVCRLPKIGKSFSFSRKLMRARSESPIKKLEETSQRGVFVSESTGCLQSPRSSSRLNRMSSPPPALNEVQTFTTQACASGLQTIKTSFLQRVEDKREMKMYISFASSSCSEVREIWPLFGFLVSLLFLLLGQVPAILATSLFFLVLSQLQKLRSSRGQGQDRDVTRRAMEASRKLNIASSPVSPVSPLRGDISSMEYRKRIIMEGLLERNRRNSGG